MTVDVLSIVEAAYAEAGDVSTWLRNAFAAIEPHMDRGAGVVAHRFAHTTDGFWMGSMEATGADAARYRAVLDGPWWEGRKEPIWTRAYPRIPTAVRVNTLLGQKWPEAMAGTSLKKAVTAAVETLRFPSDAFGVIASDPSGHGCIFFAPEPRPFRMPARVLAHWQRIAVHLATGYRLARRRSGEPDAVLDPGGKLLHLANEVTSDQRTSLSEAAQAIDKARGKLRRVDSDRALSLWRGLVDGRWSLVEQFDHDGKRFVVAKRNALCLPWHTLTEREAQAVALVAEGQPTKLVAYQLGVSIATVGGDVLKAQRKLGVPSRLQLVAAYRAHRAEERVVEPAEAATP
jgi:DNA-binding CsgD family transcriptional regulator